MTSSNGQRGEAGSVPEQTLGKHDEYLAHGSKVYLDSALAAYESRPLGAMHRTEFEPETMRARWRAANIALLVLTLLLAAGMLTPVPLGNAGTVAGVDLQDVVVTLNSDSAPERLTEVELLLRDERLSGVVMGVDRLEEGPQPVAMVLVEMDDPDLVSEDDVGSPVVVEQGSRPILVDILVRGEL